MSHFSTIKTRIVNQAAAIAALEEMGYTVEVHKRPVTLSNRYSAARQQKMKAHIVVSSAQLGCGTDFGLLRQVDGSFEIVTDTFFEPARILAERLPSAYAKHTVIQQAQQLGDEWTVQEVFENGVFAGYTVVIEKAEQLLAGQTLNVSRLTSSY